MSVLNLLVHSTSRL